MEEQELEQEQQPEIPWTLRVPLGWPAKKPAKTPEAVQFHRSRVRMAAGTGRTGKPERPAATLPQLEQTTRTGRNH